MSYRVEREIGGRCLSIETGKLARQADGAALLKYGDTVVLVTAMSALPREGIDFFPLFVEYREMMYAAGRIPGSFFRREGRPTAKETITCRMVDRPIRPLFPKGYRDEVQVIATVLSTDCENDPDVLAMIGSSAALSLSSIPFQGPTGSIRVGRVNGQLVLMPTRSELEKGDLNLVVSGTRTGITMVEAGGADMLEEVVLEAIDMGKHMVDQVIEMIEELVAAVGKPKAPFESPVFPQELFEAAKAEYYSRVQETLHIEGKLENTQALKALFQEIEAKYCPDEAEESGPSKADVKTVCHELERRAVREAVLANTRIDGRKADEIRPIECEVSALPRTHGSAIVTRGETQALVVTTLGTQMDEQRIDELMEEYSKRFILHYNFPPFSVGEVRPVRGPGRREIGHGVLAERALEQVIPTPEKFPYTIRIVSDILESNASSSMATVCGGTLCLMDAGVPITDPVAGIAMGMVKEGENYQVISDISGPEDFSGDMDFKIAGTQRGITAMQMDVKIPDVKVAMLKQALMQARQGRMEILKQMLSVLKQPRPEVSEHAPKFVVIQIDPDKIGRVIGTGGKTIRSIEEETSAKVDIAEDGRISIYAPDAESIEKATAWVKELTAEVEVGKIYTGTVKSVKDFGAFVEVLPGREGLVHISELSDGYVDSVSDVTAVGDVMKVKVIGIDNQNRVRLSRKAALQEEDE